MKNHGPPRVQRFPATKQRRLDQLLAKNSEGTISAKERATLQELVAEAEELMAANARRLAKFSRSQAARAGAVPVTVWVQAQRAER